MRRYGPVEQVAEEPLDDSPCTAVTPVLWMYINLLIVNQAVLTFESSFTWREMFGGRLSRSRSASAQPLWAACQVLIPNLKSQTRKIRNKSSYATGPMLVIPFCFPVKPTHCLLSFVLLVFKWQTCHTKGQIMVLYELFIYYSKKGQKLCES